MDLGIFLQRVTNKPKEVIDYHLIIFHGKDYPLYFFYSFIKRLKEDISFLHTIDCDTTDISQLIAILQTSFLGSSTVYWLKNIDWLTPKIRKILLEFLNDYSGPHTILLYTTSVLKLKKQKSMYVFLPESITTILSMRHVSSFFKIKLVTRLKEIVNANKVKLNLDELCLLLSYVGILGAQNDTFFDRWFPQIIAVNSSLFILSQYFFAKKRSEFFTMWSRVENHYPEAFWITFWSDQLWRAYFYVVFSLQKKNALGKQISTRLPFSFLQYDWQKYSNPDVFKNAHDFLYSLDFTIKNTNIKSSYGLDLFYSKFFLGYFS